MLFRSAAEQFLVQLAFPFGSAVVVALVAITFVIVVLFTWIVRKVFRAQV